MSAFIENREQEMDYLFAAKFIAALEKVNNYDLGGEMDLMLVSSNPIITMTYVTRHPEKKWDWQGLTNNPSIPLEYMDAHPEYPWNQDEYDFRKYGGEEAQLDSENEPCDIRETIAHLERFTEHESEMGDDMDSNDLELSLWSSISDEPNLTPEIIEQYYDKPWNYFVLSSNPLPVAKKQFKKEYLAACKIQDAFAQAKYNPTYAYCRQQHIKFYNALLL